MDSTSYYTSKYSGEEIDEAVRKILDGEMTGDYADRQLSNLDTPQGALANLGAGVRPNLLDNAIFVDGGTEGNLPVNQRGQTKYSNGYGIDRWYSVYGNTMEILQDGVKFQYVDNNYVAWQVLGNQLSYGDTITVSALLSNGILLTSSGTLSPELEDIGTPAYNDYSVHYAINTNHLNIIGFDSSKDITIQAVKLEFGENQTLAYQDADGMWHLLPQPESDYATQLSKCQRYLLMGPINAPVWCLGYAFLPTPVTIRANPAIIGKPVINSVESNTAHPDAIATVNGIVNNGVLFSLQNVTETCYLHFPVGSGISCEL